MSVSHRYRNFGASKTSGTTEGDEIAEVAEDQKLEAFEAGYQAGWDDATKAQADQKQKLMAELSQNLQDMAFTYHEALSKLTVSIEPILKQIVDKLLPELVKTSVGAHIVEQLNDMVKENLSGPVSLVVCPQSVSVIQDMIDTELPQPFELIGDDTLSEGQAFIRFAEVERQIDLDAVLRDVRKALEGFFHEAAQRGENG